MKDNWFRIVVAVVAAILTHQVAVFLHNISWSYAYAERGECLDRIYARGYDNGFDSKQNCYDIIAPFQ